MSVNFGHTFDDRYAIGLLDGPGGMSTLNRQQSQQVIGAFIAENGGGMADLLAARMIQQVEDKQNNLSGWVRPIYELEQMKMRYAGHNGSGPLRALLQRNKGLFRDIMGLNKKSRAINKQTRQELGLGVSATDALRAEYNRIAPTAVPPRVIEMPGAELTEGTAFPMLYTRNPLRIKTRPAPVPYLRFIVSENE